MSDAGTVDSGATDAIDAGMLDAGARDAATPNAEGPDAAVPDAAVPDAAVPDAAVPDAGMPDGGTPDAGTPDAGTPDAGTPDAGTPDAGMPDAGMPDAGTPDAGMPGGGTVDAGVPDAGMPGGGTLDAGMPDAGVPDAGTPADAPIASQTVALTCLGDPCPWGDSLTTEAVVWPASEGTVNTQLGYLVAAGIYLPGVRANGTDISIESGEATVYWGFPDEDSLRLLATLEAGDTFHVEGIPDDSVLSVQADAPFTYRIALPTSSGPGPGAAPPADVIASTQAFWRCNLPGCTFPDWTGAVIGWQSWAAYQTNARSGDQSRSVFDGEGTPLFPYMGSWAQGCEVTAESGVALIIEWQRGTNVWRETWLYPRQSHTIDLVAPEDGAMIETYDGSPGFSVSLKNCTPQPIAP